MCPKIHILMTHAQNRRTTAGYPVLGFFQKCSRFICPKYIIYRDFLSKKKSWSHGTTLGWLGGLISRGNIVRIFFYFHIAQNRSIWPISRGHSHRCYSFKVRQQRSLCQSTARPAGGRWNVILCKIDRNIIGNKPTKKFCSSFKTEAAPVTLRN